MPLPEDPVNPAWRRPITILILTALLGSPAFGQPGSTPGESFARELSEALLDSAGRQDALWAPGVRDSTTRFLDLRTALLFQWTDVDVVLEGERGLDRGEIEAVLRVRGTATWDPKAYAVGTAFWSLQLDEEAERNDVVRREAWTIVETEEGWRGTRRRLLPNVDVVSAEIDAGIYPGQEAILATCTYYLRSLVDGAATCRFLLDRRAHVYGLEVNGARTDLVRGGEIGGLGLEGFSPELESSLRFPEPLREGEEVLVKFRMVAPIVHMTTDRFVTSVPIHDGPFRERAWIPLLELDRPRARNTEIDLTLRWPREAFEDVAISAGGNGFTVEDGTDLRTRDEAVLRVRGRGDVRRVDFVLGAPGVSLGTAGPESARLVVPAPSRAVDRLRREGEGDGEIRTRRALVGPLLEAATMSGRDLTSEIQDLLPLDLDLFEQLLDRSNEDAGDEGADDRSAR